MNFRFAVIVAAGLCASSAQAQVVIEKAWVRATMPGQTTAAGYMEIRSSAPADLVSVSSPAAKVAEIHEMSMENGVMKMRAVPRLALQPGKTVELKPGGYHIMLAAVAKPLRPGDSVPITLTVETPDKKRSTVQVIAPVRDGTR